MNDSAYHSLNEEPYFGQAVDAEENYIHSAPQPAGEEDFLLAPLAIYGDKRENGTSQSEAQMDKNWATAFKVNVIVTVLSAAVFGFMAVDLVADDAASGAGFKRRLQGRPSSSGACVMYLYSILDVFL